MANVLGDNPIYVDTVGATVVTANPIFVRGFWFCGAAGSVVSVANAAGHPVWTAILETGNLNVGMSIGCHIHGLTVTITTSGGLYIYV